jgi:uncharacterized protein involved in high-affinity Fe2+ transport|tara:strand:+ start:1004 stop:1534 length:531 start_codon:yes stop_codon:yes gene_type:complete
MKIIYFLLLTLGSINSDADEMIIGRETISPGINLIFEGAPKDTVLPQEFFLAESATDIHIEMLANWSKASPTGAPVGGFVAYLKIFATLEAASGGRMTVQLTPHLNMSDNLHYAQNIKLPGRVDESYRVMFEINPPDKSELGIHFDWNEEVGFLVQPTVFTYDNLNFKDIALSSRR